MFQYQYLDQFTEFKCISACLNTILCIFHWHTEYRTKTYRKYQNIHILLFHLRAIFSEPGSSSQHGKPFLLKGNFIYTCIFKLFYNKKSLGRHIYGLIGTHTLL